VLTRGTEKYARKNVFPRKQIRFLVELIRTNREHPQILPYKPLQATNFSNTQVLMAFPGNFFPGNYQNFRMEKFYPKMNWVKSLVEPNLTRIPKMPYRPISINYATDLIIHSTKYIYFASFKN